MAKLKDFNNILKSQLDDVANEIKSSRFMRQLGEQILSDVVTRVRLGYGVSRDGAGKSKFKSLSKSYIQQRRNKLGFFTRPDGTVVPISTDSGKVSANQLKKNRTYLKRNSIKLASSTSPAKSNLTQTGEMIRSMKVNVKTGKIKIVLGTAENKKKAEYVSKVRPFMHLSRQELKRARLLVQSRLRIILKSKINF